jgi:hypothetical protein
MSPATFSEDQRCIERFSATPDRAERQRAARGRTEEKQRKKEEKAALRKAEREAAEAPPDEKQTTGQP